MSVCVFQDNKSLVMLTNTLYMHYLHKAIGVLYCEKWKVVDGGKIIGNYAYNFHVHYRPHPLNLCNCYYISFQCNDEGIILIGETNTTGKQSLRSTVALMIQTHKNYVRRHGEQGNSQSNTRFAKVSDWIEAAVMKIDDPKVNTGAPNGYLQQLSAANVIDCDFIEEFNVRAYAHYCHKVSVS